MIFIGPTGVGNARLSVGLAPEEQQPLATAPTSPPPPTSPPAVTAPQSKALDTTMRLFAHPCSSLKNSATSHCPPRPPPRCYKSSRSAT